ncbi:hypothetical protein V8E54_009722 [Elaphomyces granulatus]
MDSTRSTPSTRDIPCTQIRIVYLVVVDFVLLRKMLIPDPNLQLELEFLTQPPATILRRSLFPQPVVVHYNPYARFHSALSPRVDFTLWIPGPQDSLRFEAEFIPVGPGPSALGAVFPFPSNTVIINVSSDEVLFTTRRLRFRPLAVPVPGIYQLQVSGYRDIDRSRGTLLAQALSDSFCVTSSPPPSPQPRPTRPSARPPLRLQRSETALTEPIRTFAPRDIIVLRLPIRTRGPIG